MVIIHRYQEINLNRAFISSKQIEYDSVSSE
jgi:hypothetical protein